MKWLFLIYASIVSFHFSQAATKDPLRLNVVLAVSESSSWNHQKMMKTIERSNRLFKQCEITIRPIQIQTGIPPEMSVGGVWKSYAEAVVQGMKVPVIFFVNQSENPKSVGLTPNSQYIMLSAGSLEGEFRKERPANYESLAHELGHLLGISEHTKPSQGKNLMAGYKARLSTRLTEKQCETLRASPYFQESGVGSF